MGFTESVNVLTILIFFLIILTFHNSDADDCIYQITSHGRMNINFNGREAFHYAYFNIKYKIISKYDILRQYFIYLFDEAINVYKGDTILKPMDWCINYISSIKLFGTNILRDTLESICDGWFIYSGFSSRGGAITSLKYAYYELEYTFEDFKNISDESKTYYIYLFEAFLPTLVNFDAKGPKLYCQNYSVNRCLDVLTNDGGMNINFNGGDAFRHAYLKFNVKKRPVIKFVILRQYMTYLMNAAIEVNKEESLLSPMKWCKKYISNTRLFDTSALGNMLESICDEWFEYSGFSCKEDAMQSLVFAYYNIDNIFINFEFISDKARKYYNYLLENFLPNVVVSNADGPELYCQNYLVNRCINVLTNDGGMNINFNGKDAFKYAYLNLSSYKTKGSKKIFLQIYLKYLFDIYILILTDNIILKPIEWCINNIEEYIKNIEDFNKNKICNDYLKVSGFDSEGDAKAALTYAYYNIVITKTMNNLSTAYYNYMIDTFLQYIGNSVEQGPVKYCQSFNSSLKSESVYGQSDNNVFTQFYNDQPRPEYFDAQYAEQYSYYNQASSSTSAGLYNSDSANQYSFNQATQCPGQSSNSSEIPFTPSLYISTPDNYYSNDPNYDPHD